MYAFDLEPADTTLVAQGTQAQYRTAGALAHGTSWKVRVVSCFCKSTLKLKEMQRAEEHYGIQYWWGKLVIFLRGLFSLFSEFGTK